MGIIKKQKYKSGPKYCETTLYEAAIFTYDMALFMLCLKGLLAITKRLYILYGNIDNKYRRNGSSIIYEPLCVSCIFLMHKYEVTYKQHVLRTQQDRYLKKWI